MNGNDKTVAPAAASVLSVVLYVGGHVLDKVTALILPLTYTASRQSQRKRDTISSNGESSRAI